MKYPAVITSIYACIILSGGIFGYVKSGSQASIIMAAVFTCLLFLSSWAAWNEKPAGYVCACLLTVLLAGFFLLRFFKTGLFMPAGMIFILSLVVLLLLYKTKSGTLAA